jgi:hypothetical protein
MWVEAIKTVCVRFPEGDLRMEPGQPVDLSPDRAELLVTKGEGKIRFTCQYKAINCVLWRRGRMIVGPGNLELDDGPRWVLVSWKGDLRWISKSLLCS